MRLNDWKFKATDIKGKKYIDITERIMAFRNCDEFNGWSLETEMLNYSPDSVVFKCIAKDETGRIRSTGYAQEDRGSSNVNSTSYIENAESSSVGRCLGILGIGCDASIASAEEVKNAIKKQESNPDNKQQVNKAEIREFNVKGSDGQMYNVPYKKCFNKAKNEWFYALVNPDDVQYGFPKYLKCEA